MRKEFQLYATEKKEKARSLENEQKGISEGLKEFV